MPQAAVNLLRNPWIAILAGLLVALGGLQLGPETTWAELLRPANVFPALGLLGAQLLALNADRPWGAKKGSPKP